MVSAMRVGDRGDSNFDTGDYGPAAIGLFHELLADVETAVKIASANSSAGNQQVPLVTQLRRANRDLAALAAKAVANGTGDNFKNLVEDNNTYRVNWNLNDVVRSSRPVLTQTELEQSWISQRNLIEYAPSLLRRALALYNAHPSNETRGLLGVIQAEVADIIDVVDADLSTAADNSDVGRVYQGKIATGILWTREQKTQIVESANAACDLLQQSTAITKPAAVNAEGGGNAVLSFIAGATGAPNPVNALAALTVESAREDQGGFITRLGVEKINHVFQTYFKGIGVDEGGKAFQAGQVVGLLVFAGSVCRKTIPILAKKGWIPDFEGKPSVSNMMENPVPNSTSGQTAGAASPAIELPSKELPWHKFKGLSDAAQGVLDTEYARANKKAGGTLSPERWLKEISRPDSTAGAAENRNGPPDGVQPGSQGLPEPLPQILFDRAAVYSTHWEKPLIFVQNLMRLSYEKARTLPGLTNAQQLSKAGEIADGTLLALSEYRDMTFAFEAASTLPDKDFISYAAQNIHSLEQLHTFSDALAKLQVAYAAANGDAKVEGLLAVLKRFLPNNEVDEVLKKLKTCTTVLDDMPIHFLSERLNTPGLAPTTLGTVFLESVAQGSDLSLMAQISSGGRFSAKAVDIIMDTLPWARTGPQLETLTPARFSLLQSYFEACAADGTTPYPQIVDMIAKGETVATQEASTLSNKVAAWQGRYFVPAEHFTARIEAYAENYNFIEVVAVKNGPQFVVLPDNSGTSPLLRSLSKLPMPPGYRPETNLWLDMKIAYLPSNQNPYYISNDTVISAGSRLGASIFYKKPRGTWTALSNKEGVSLPEGSAIMVQRDQSSPSLTFTLPRR